MTSQGEARVMITSDTSDMSDRVCPTQLTLRKSLACWDVVTLAGVQVDMLHLQGVCFSCFQKAQNP